MANLTIRNLDDGVVASLKAQAKRNNRSLEAELRQVLTRVAKQRERLSAFVEAAERIAAMTPKDRPQSDSAELLREDRDR